MSGNRKRVSYDVLSSEMDSEVQHGAPQAVLMPQVLTYSSNQT